MTIIFYYGLQLLSPPRNEKSRGKSPWDSSRLENFDANYVS